MDTVYQMQQDRLAILKSEDALILPLTNDFIISLGFTLENPKSSLNRFKMALNDNVIHIDGLDNKVFVVYLNNKHVPNCLTRTYLINLINLFK